MSRRDFAAILAFLLVLTTVPAAGAQAPPDTIEPALAALSDHLGLTVTLASLDSWYWTRQNYPDTSLGCPQPGEVYAQGLTNGYKFTLVYQQIAYDVRISANGSTALLCQPASAAGDPTAVTPTPTPARAPRPTINPSVPPPTNPGKVLCPDAPPSLLATGMEALLAPGVLTGNLRASPDTTSPILNQLQPGDTITLLDGPICAEQHVWWQADFATLIGWIAETDGDTPVILPRDRIPSGPPSPNAPPGGASPVRPVLVYDLPAQRERIAPTNAAQLAPLKTLFAPDAIQALAWSPSGETLAAGGQAGIWLFDTTNLAAPPRLLQVQDAPVLALAFAPSPSGTALLASSHTNATVRLWDVSTGGQLAVLSGHGVPINALAFSADGTLLAAGSGGDTVDGNVIDLWTVETRTRAASLNAHTRPVTGLAFSPDGTLLASSSDDQTVRLWDIVSTTLASVLQGHDAPVKAVDFAPDGRWLAAITGDGTLHLWDIMTRERRILPGSSSEARALLFLPHSSLFATAAGSILSLWDQDALQALTRLEPAPRATVTALTAGPDSTILAASTTTATTTAPPTTTITLYGVLPPT